MKIKITAIIIAWIFLLPSCATIVSKSTYPITIKSTPSNAKITIIDKKGKEIYLGNTPVTLNLKAGAGYFSRAEYQVRFSSNGYDDRIVQITFSIDNWYFGNIPFGGFIGMLIFDPATGAMWKIDTDYLNETLTQSTTSVDPKMEILDINEVPENWKGHLVSID